LILHIYTFTYLIYVLFTIILSGNYQKEKKYHVLDIKKISNESILDQPYPSPATSRDASQTGIKKHKTYAKEEDIKTVMDMLPIDSDNVKRYY
jgi:hypothetical protein